MKRDDQLSIGDIINVLKTITLKHPPFPIRLAVGTMNDKVAFYAFTMVPDRETGRLVEVTHVDYLSKYDGYYKEAVLARAESFLRSVFLHELFECFHVEGIRIRDPHAAEARKIPPLTIKLDGIFDGLMVTKQ